MVERYESKIDKCQIWTALWVSVMLVLHILQGTIILEFEETHI